MSALGFGVMGMTYNRSQHPDKKACIRLLHEAVDRGITLFDTAIIYGPLTNENLAGEALSEFKGSISITTKFGHEVINGKGTGRQDSSRKTVRQYCEDSLRRLKLDSLPPLISMYHLKNGANLKPQSLQFLLWVTVTTLNSRNRWVVDANII